MMALVLVAQGELVLEDRPIPRRPRPEAVLVRVQRAGICGSDVHRAFGGGAYRYPLVMGHEFAGVVEEAFPGSGRAVGERVAVYPLLPCGRCAACAVGAYQACESYDYLGSRSDGGFAELVWVPELNCIPVPEGVPILHAALTEPAAVALHGVRKLRLHGGETAVVFGGGPVGNLVAQWLRILGCPGTVVVETDRRKLALAHEMGFATLDPASGDPVQAVRQMTGGAGAALTVEACGLPVTYRQAVEAASRAGEVLLLGNIRGDLVLSESEVSAVLRRELTIHGTWNSTIVPRGQDDWSTALSFMGAGLHVEELVSHTPPLAEGPATFRALASGRESFGRVVFEV